MNALNGAFIISVVAEYQKKRIKIYIRSFIARENEQLKMMTWQSYPSLDTQFGLQLNS